MNNSHYPHRRSGPTIVFGAWAIAVALAGCKKDIRPDVEMGMILPPGAARTVVPEDQAFLVATEISAPLPRYPAELIARSHAPITACAEIVIETDGSVRTVRPLYGIPECPQRESELDARFTAAVKDAMLTWEFFAAAVCTFPPGVPKDEECKAEGVTIKHVPIKLAFVFTFATKNGRAHISRKRT